MRRVSGLVLLAAMAVAAGCIGAVDEDGAGELAADEADRTTMEDPTAALEAGEDAANLDLLHHWAVSDGQEADPAGDHLYVSRGDHVSILDTSDPNRTTEVGTIDDVPNSLDVKVTGDGRFAFVADDTEASGDPQGGTGPLTGGIYTVDVSDPEDPERLDYEPVGNSRGPHMVYYHNATDGEYVYAAAGNEVVIHAFYRGEGVLQEVARYEPGQGTQDRHPSSVGAYYNPRAWLHDMFVHEDPDGPTMMYVAAWDGGLHVVDVSDPENPEREGVWNDFSEDEPGNLHTVATEWIGDTRVTVGSVEVGFDVVGGTEYAEGDEESTVYVWDTTDPSNPTLVTRWTNPVEETTGRTTTAAGELPGENLTSPHNLQLENGRLYLAHYKLGVWVLDLSTAEAREDPTVLGYRNTEDMNVWDVVLQDGAVYTSGQSGVRSLAFPLEAIGPGGVTSRA
jgi:hypothetical protein